VKILGKLVYMFLEFIYSVAGRKKPPDIPAGLPDNWRLFITDVR